MQQHKMAGLDRDLQSLIDKECAKANTQAVLLRVQSGDGWIDFRGSAGDALPETRFFIASITKMFTATIIMKLNDEGLIDLDQSVHGLLPQAIYQICIQSTVWHTAMH